jgi:hypothetical protein
MGLDAQKGRCFLIKVRLKHTLHTNLRKLLENDNGTQYVCLAALRLCLAPASNVIDSVRLRDKPQTQTHLGKFCIKMINAVGCFTALFGQLSGIRQVPNQDPTCSRTPKNVGTTD